MAVETIDVMDAANSQVFKLAIREKVTISSSDLHDVNSFRWFEPGRISVVKSGSASNKIK